MNLTLKYSDDIRAARTALEYLDWSHLQKYSIVFQREHYQQPEDGCPNIVLCEELPSTLAVLRLVGVDVSVNNRSGKLDGILGCLNFPVLNRLELCYCTNMDVLFAAIRTPILKHFVLHLRYEIDFDTREYCHSVRAQLNVFLRGFCGLETLLLQTRLLPQTVAYDVLQQHAPTLRIYLSDMSGWPDLFLSSCFKALKQYSIYKVNDFLEPGYRTVIVSPKQVLQIIALKH